METLDRKQHWENVYNTKRLADVSWYQPKPEISLQLINNTRLAKHASIIDIGGGDSLLADHLLQQGYTNITVLDISQKAIERAKQRLGDEAEKIKWIVTDILDFHPAEKYDLWHDRAAFHFITSEDQIAQYTGIATQATTGNSRLIIGTFSDEGPKKCSGLDTKQYSETALRAAFTPAFTSIECTGHDHHTPFNTVQKFQFCVFQKALAG